MAHNNNNFVGAGHQFASVWDNGENLVDHLKHEIQVRQIGLNRFGQSVIRAGEPLSSLENVLLPLYMHHRFQLNSAAQSIGGADYTYAMRGDGQTAFTIVDGAEQRDALETVLSTLTVDFLALPADILELIPPSAYRYNQGEPFPGRTGLLFDPLGAAEASVNLSVSQLLHPMRMSRLVAYGAMGDYPNLEEVIDRLLEVTWNADQPSGDYQLRLLQVLQRVTADELMRQASNNENGGSVRAVLSDRLNQLAVRLENQRNPNPHQATMAADIRRWQQRPENTVPAPALQLPPGDPI